MCYYRTVKLKNQQVLKIGEVERPLGGYQLDAPLLDGFAYGSTPIIVPNNSCGWDIVQMEWGFLPNYLSNRAAVEGFRRGYTDSRGIYRPPMTTLNAVGEELLLPNKVYRNAALQRRCLFISSCFYEWQHHHPIGKKGLPLKTAVKQPYQIFLKDAEQLILTAGVWQSWTDKETGETVDTCALITTRANPLMELIHNSKKRMPTILTPSLAAEWISDGVTEKRITELATYQYPSELMEAVPIEKDFIRSAQLDNQLQ